MRICRKRVRDRMFKIRGRRKEGEMDKRESVTQLSHFPQDTEPRQMD